MSNKFEFDLNRLLGKPSESIFKAVIGITDEGIGIIMSIKDRIKLNIENLFDGIMLENNLTEQKNVPIEPGIYNCDIHYISFRCNHPEDPEEWDVNVYIDNVIKSNIKIKL